MSMFQQSVLKIFSQDESLVAIRWAKFQEFLAKIDFVKSVKEEKYQEGFLKDIFENCLGYTLDSTNPSDFNLEREKKNETDSKKADGVIYLNKEVVGVIELKGQDTKNLDKVQQQAFWYLTQHTNAKYVIISNFDELRFYFDKSTAYEKFSLFELDYEAFKKLHLLLSFESIKEGTPLKIKEKTANFEAQISKELYKDFSTFRTHLFENLIRNNKTIEKSNLLRLTQKLCDRIIFILFAEDRGLLNPNTIKEIREEFKAQKFTEYKLYDIYKFYFKAINEGNEKLQIPKYNGGLFANDEELDSLIIDDTSLDMEAQKLSDYDFASEVGVNILGHIFEQSLTDLEEIQATIDQSDFDKTKSKRKKDGVFYTPEYITKYIVENTLGKMCLEKREELNLTTVNAPKNLKKLTKTEQQTKDNLEIYKDWLFNLKILDPACGSGAFLNQALEYLIQEHTNLQNDLALMGDLFASYQVEESVLEHNLYGVDINEDAVEIAKLSLWLRTAKRGRPLTRLADKIKCANSLLDMPFSENSFDVVIGNPPYVRQEAIKHLKDDLKEKYQVFTGTADLYVYFYELGIRMLKENSLLGYICSNKFYKSKYGEKLRDYILTNTTIELFTNFEDKKVFEDATVTSDINIFKKEKPQKQTMFKMVDVGLVRYYEMMQSDLNKLGFVFLPLDKLNLKSKIEKNGIILKKWDIAIKSGIKTGFNEAFIIDEVKKDELIKLDKKNEEIIKPYLRGRDVSKYNVNFANKYLIVSKYKGSDNIIYNYPTIYSYLTQYQENLQKRGQVTNGQHHWLELDNNPQEHYLDLIESDKIIWIELSDLGKFTYDDNGFYIDMTIFFITGNSLKYLLALLNSELIFWYFNLICAESGVGTNRWKKTYVEQIPIPKIDEEKQQTFIKFVDEILESKQKIKDYKILLDEAIKNDNFDREIKLKKELQTLENICSLNEKEIDQMVYKLYDLTDDEIKIVEAN